MERSKKCFRSSVEFIFQNVATLSVGIHDCGFRFVNSHWTEQTWKLPTKSIVFMMYNIFEWILLDKCLRFSLLFWEANRTKYVAKPQTINTMSVRMKLQHYVLLIDTLILSSVIESIFHNMNEVATWQVWAPSLDLFLFHLHHFLAKRYLERLQKVCASVISSTKWRQK